MYHFVGCHESLKGISLDDFRRQLDFLQKNYSKEGFLITFDHGTIDHFNVAAPELEKRNIKGVFFILTMAQEEKKVHFVDKQRFLEAKQRRELAKLLCTEMGMAYKPQEAKDYLKEFCFYSLEERYLRFIRDTQISRESYDAFIDKHFRKVFGDEAAFAEREYLSWDHVIDLHRRGHIIGSHTHYHYGDKADYALSKKMIEEKIQDHLELVSYPNGVKRISDEELASLEITKGYYSRDVHEGPYGMGRLDCNQLNIQLTAP